MGYWDNLSFWKKTKLILTIILSVFVAVFAFINWKTAPVSFVFVDVEVSITLLILICLLVGYLIASLFESKHYNTKVREINTLNKEIDQLKTENKQLENRVELLTPKADDAPSETNTDEEIN